MPAAQSARLPGPGNADACRVPGLEGLAVPGGCGLCDTRWFASHVLRSPKAYTAVCRVLQEPRGRDCPAAGEAVYAGTCCQAEGGDESCPGPRQLALTECRGCCRMPRPVPYMSTVSQQTVPWYFSD